MLYTFQSKAGASVLMLGSHAQPLLKAMGKDDKAREGIITPEQIPAALADLQTYIDKQEAAPQNQDAQHADDEDAPQAEVGVRVSARALPLMQLLQASAAHNTFVTWATE